MKTKIFWLAGCGSLVVLLLAVAAIPSGAMSWVTPKRVSQPEAQPEDPIVMTINGEPVSAREYKLVMDRSTALVYSYFKERENLEDHLGYWKENGKAENPLRHLRHSVQEELVRIKVIQGLAKQKGLLKDTTYAGFHQNLISENARRAKALANAEVIYGPQQYREAAYYYIVLGNLNYQLQQSIAREPGESIPEAQIKSYYQENKKQIGKRTLAEMHDGIAEHLKKQNYEKKIRTLCETARVEINAPLLTPLVPRQDP